MEEFNVKLDGVPLMTKSTVSYRKAVEVCLASYWIWFCHGSTDRRIVWRCAKDVSFFTDFLILTTDRSCKC